MRSQNKGLLAVIAMVFGGVVSAWATTPPALINYEGVLRDQATGLPLTATVDLVFTFYPDAAGIGTDILSDTHTGVVVSGGLFNVQLGGGSVADGAGPGNYTSLIQVFRDYGQVWMEIQVDAQTLAPRVQVVSSAYAMYSAHAGRAAGGCFNTIDRFVDCGNGTVTDTVTGLIWLKNAYCADLGNTGFVNQTFAAANGFASSLHDGQCGLTDNSAAGDWRLPTKDELTALETQALANGCGSPPYIPDTHGLGCYPTEATHVFTSVHNNYWSSSTTAGAPDTAWAVGLGTGLGGNTPKTLTFPAVWPVRAPR